MKKLKEILYKVAIEAVLGSTSRFVTGISLDSRNVTKNSIFVAIKGTERDGHDYIDKALASGARSIICEQLPKKINKDVV